jgi:hypothetical protein
MIEQHKLLNKVAELGDAGKIRTTLSETLGTINAASLKKADAMIESGRRKRKAGSGRLLEPPASRTNPARTECRAVRCGILAPRASSA